MTDPSPDCVASPVAANGSPDSENTSVTASSALQTPSLPDDGSEEVPAAPPAEPLAAPLAAPAPAKDGASNPPKERFIPLVSVVDFHHARGPEVESWFGAEEGVDPAVEYEWPLLPFMALSDGAHASEEDFSYFTLLRPSRDPSVPPTSLFGISCTRQLDAAQLINRPADVTRSTVQKAVVVIAESPQSFGLLRTRLSVVTHAWFAQREFSDTDILRRFQESLAEGTRNGTIDADTARDQNLGMSLRELVREFKWQTLVLLKCCLLQRKMLFFGSKCDRLCMVQFSLISLIPGLIRHLQDCADPDLNSLEATRRRSTSLRTSDRTSLLTYMGLPLQIFGKGSLFGPYTPLQQLDVLADVGTKSYIVGSTNSLLLQQRDRYSDILINLDDNTITITSASLRSALALSTPDRRWIDYITSTVNDTWDEANPGRPSTHQYIGSEDFIRTQFEEYILALVASVKYQKFAEANPNNPSLLLADVDGNPAVDFGPEFLDAWERTENYRLWNQHTDSHIFDICEPKHPAAGGLTIEDVQRRIAEQVKELHLDEKFAQGREVLGRNLAAGRDKAASVINRLYSDMEARRRAAAAARGLEPAAPVTAVGAVDLPKTAQNAGTRAGSYMNSLAAWAGEKRKQVGWGGGSQATASSKTKAGGGGSGGGGGGGGWGFGYGKKTSAAAAKDGSGITTTPGERDYQIVNSPGSRLSESSFASTAADDDAATAARRLTMGSRGSLFSTGSVPASIQASPMRRPDSSRSDVSSRHRDHNQQQTQQQQHAAGAGSSEPDAATAPKVVTIEEDGESEKERGDDEDDEGDEDEESDGDYEKPKPAELIELERSVWDSPMVSGQPRFDTFQRPDHR